MKRVCAWCKKSMGEVQSILHDNHAITHGICDSCLNDLFIDKNIDFIPFLNSISAPVILIDEENTYLSANDSALNFLGKDHQHFKQKKTGDIFTCENAHLPGGCGYTDKCGGCQLIKLINDTYEGENHFEHVPITITQQKDNTRQKVNLKLTTEKVNGLVLMRIDDHS